jgi:hypothetical protein
VGEVFEHLVVELERKAADRWLVGPHDAQGRRDEHASPAGYLDQLGGDGWELVSVTPLHARSSLGGVQTDVVMYTLRRPARPRPRP